MKNQLTNHKKTIPKNTYNPCVDYFKEKYKLNQTSVIELMIRAKGIVPN